MPGRGAGGGNSGGFDEEGGLLRARIRTAAQSRVQEIASDTRNQMTQLIEQLTGVDILARDLAGGANMSDERAAGHAPQGAARARALLDHLPRPGRGQEG